MNVSPNELRKETVQTLRRVNEQISKLELARGANAPIEMMATLLLAKTQCINTLVLLRVEESNRKR